MRGRTKAQASMLAFVDPETLIPADHPLRTMRQLTNEALADLRSNFEARYSHTGPPGICEPLPNATVANRCRHCRQQPI